MFEIKKNETVYFKDGNAVDLAFIMIFFLLRFTTLYHPLITITDVSPHYHHH